MPISAGEIRALLSGIDDDVMVYINAEELLPEELTIGRRHEAGEELKSLETDGKPWVDKIENITIRQSPGSYIVDSSKPSDSIEMWSLVPVLDDNDKVFVGCWDCGIEYGEPGWTESIVHQHDWEIIIGDLYEQTFLCVPCIKERAERYGVKDLRIWWFECLSDNEHSDPIIEGPEGWYEQFEKDTEKLRGERLNKLASQSEKTSGFDKNTIAFSFKPYHSIGDIPVVYAGEFSLGIRYLLPGEENYVGLRELGENIFGPDHRDIEGVLDDIVEEIRDQTKQELNILLTPVRWANSPEPPIVAFWCHEPSVVDRIIDELTKKRELIWGS